MLMFYILSGLLHFFSVMNIWSLIMTSTDPGYFTIGEIQSPLLKEHEFLGEKSPTLRGLKKDMYK